MIVKDGWDVGGFVTSFFFSSKSTMFNTGRKEEEESSSACSDVDKCEEEMEKQLTYATSKSQFHLFFLCCLAGLPRAHFFKIPTPV
jgi:hypothetical protein